jgi:hypothetical protein
MANNIFQSLNRINYGVPGMSSTPQPGMTKWAWLGSGDGKSPSSPIDYVYASDPRGLVQTVSRGGGEAGIWTSVVEDDERGARINGTLSTAEATSGKYGHDGIGWYIKKDYKEPAPMKVPAPTLAPTPSPIDSVARGTGLGKASMLPSRLGGYNFMRKM